MTPTVSHASILSTLPVIQASRYARLAAVTIVYFDHMLMFDQEIHYVWHDHWSFINTLYLINRYYALLAGAISVLVFFSNKLDDSMYVARFLQLTMALPTFQQIWEGVTGLLYSLLGQAILLLRIHALYRKSRMITYSLLVTMIVCASISGYYMWRNIFQTEAFALPVPGYIFCYRTPDENSTLYVFWIPIIAFEGVLCSLALLPGIHTLLQDQYYFQHSGNLLKIILRDSAVYFLVIASTAIACLLGTLLDNGTYVEAVTGWSVTLTCTVGSRLILNIREAFHRQSEYPKTSIRATGPPDSVVSDIKFRRNRNAQYSRDENS